ncbi:MAG: ATP-grasp domain-containing protein [Clostridia bacterium]|nr:ATP-grasp domain-containing protein [Clostridia bacterium]
MTILITSVGTATSVNLIRFLKRKGISVAGTDLNPYGYTAGSMMADAFAQIPPAADPGFFPALLGAIRRFGADLLIPVHDEEVVFLADKREQIPCGMLLAEAPVIRLFHDKIDSCRAMERIGIPVPARLDRDDPSRPRVLKKRISVGSKGVTILAPGEPCPESDLKENLLQTYVSGEEYTVDALCDPFGKPAYLVPRKRLEVKSGVATKVLVEKETGLIALAEKILEAYPIPGFSNLQFIRDEGGRYWFVEVNPRFSGCGAATLAVCEGYLDSWLSFAEGKPFEGTLNRDVRWQSVVTRYYEEKVYHADHL